jgi:ribosomal-protein-alanine N-acetyltransferase
MSDYVRWAELRSESRDHLRPWEPAWAIDELTRAAFRRRVRHYQREAQDDLGYAFLIFREDDNRLIGGLSLASVRRGVSQSASLGYWLGRGSTGQGFMTDAVSAAVQFSFGQLRLHRLEAASMPSNTASIRVLERTGFVREGYAPEYLKINGKWSDHVLFGLLESGRTATGEESRS